VPPPRTAGAPSAAQPAGAGASAATGSGLKPGEIPSTCAVVTLPARLTALGVATSGRQTVRSADRSDPLPTSEPDAENEERAWPGLTCVYPATSGGQEATIRVLPDTSPFYTARMTTSCKPTFGTGERVTLGPVPGWYCPTTNESAIEWVAYARSGRLVIVSRLGEPTPAPAHKAALVALAADLTARV